MLKISKTLPASEESKSIFRFFVYMPKFLLVLDSHLPIIWQEWLIRPPSKPPEPTSKL